MLDAVGIASETREDPPWYVLSVETAQSARALEQLALYEHERRPAPPAPPPPPAHPDAWIGCLAYAAVLILIGLSVSNGLWGPNAFDAGALDAARVQAGEWWRAWTALTLHLDGQHLAANLLVGLWFGLLAGRQQGPGHAWFLVLNGAAGANLIEALLAAPMHDAVGASTAVFTALGLLSAYSWSTQARWTSRWVSRWAPLVCGVVLLGWLGSGGGDDAARSAVQVDVTAHALGFAAGIVAGLLVARARAQRLLGRIPQWISGLVALAEIAAAWRLAVGG